MFFFFLSINFSLSFGKVSKKGQNLKFNDLICDRSWLCACFGADLTCRLLTLSLRFFICPVSMKDFCQHPQFQPQTHKTRCVHVSVRVSKYKEQELWFPWKGLSIRISRGIEQYCQKNIHLASWDQKTIETSTPSLKRMSWSSYTVIRFCL